MKRRVAVGLVLSLLVIGVDHAQDVAAGNRRGSGRARAVRLTPTPRLLDCLRNVESERVVPLSQPYDHVRHIHSPKYRQGYRAVSKSGRYRGGYQFSWLTWVAAVRAMGRPTLAEQTAEHASPQDQDDVAGYLVSTRGTQPWPNAKGCRP